MAVLTELEPGSSSSSSSSSAHDHNRTYDYDVFLSFRGVDTRNSFTDHLYNALLDAGVNTFLDDEEIETGESLKPEPESAIQSSRASIIVLSKNYASSTWCLDELVLILEQKRKFNRIVIPIFYHVEPTHVRKQQNSFGEAMEKHKRTMDAESNVGKRGQLAQKMESWKKALTEVADLKGLDVKDKKETEVIKKVVANIHRRLRVPLSNTMPRLIGRYLEMKSISSWLSDTSCHTPNIITIVGMSGVGKSFLARHVFVLHSSRFDKSSFIEDINRKVNENSNGLLDLQKQLHGDITKKMELQVNDVTRYTSMIENVLKDKRVLIVLDDIGSLKQLDALLENKGLHQGSKVIITTNDASLTKRCALFKSQGHHNHKEVVLNGLCKRESLKLLCIHAFNSQNPKEGYKEVSKKLVKYCDGHPLAIEVLGRYLQDQDVEIWTDCIEVLKEDPNSDINTKLKMSFDALQYENDKELFKHIACFFVGMDRDVSETILDACGIKTKIGMRNLLDKSLLSIDWDRKLVMHSLIQKMGRDLVRQESPKKPWERSRLWCHKESFEVFKNKQGTGNIIGLALDMRMLEKENTSGPLQLHTDALSNMGRLKLLQLNYANINGSYQNVSKELRWLCMHGFPFKSIPSELPLEKLVVLDMSHSNIEYFNMSYSSLQRSMSKLKGLIGLSSNGERLLGSLKILDLSFCEQLHKVGGFFLLPALERLILRNCIGLIEVCESVGHCEELVHIDLSYCYKLRKLPKSLGKLKKVKTILLDGCNSYESQVDMGTVKAVPSLLKFFMIPLPSSLRILSLADNNLSNECFPMDLSSLAMLEELCLERNPIVSMPNCVRTLPRLERLYLDNCHKMISIEHPPCTLRYLSFYDSYNGASHTLRKIKFDAKMCALELRGLPLLLLLCEIDGMVKTQDMTSVEEKVLHTLGWKILDIIKERPLELRAGVGGNSIICQTQMYYEFGIFSTFYEGKEMPDWISYRSKGSSISFTIPSSPNNLRGLNFCCVVFSNFLGLIFSCIEPSMFDGFKLPRINIRNITQNHTWFYKHCFDGKFFFEYSEKHSEDFEYFCGDVEKNYEDGEENFEDGEENYENGEKNFEDGEEHSKGGEEHIIDVKEFDERYCFCFLSHWMFGPNEMKAGDHISITVHDFYFQHTIECGIGLVYDEDGKNEEEEEDLLGYYRSWNHIIGGDLSPFQLSTGAYILDNWLFRRYNPETMLVCYPIFDFINDFRIKFKEEKISFKAFSQGKSDLA